MQYNGALPFATTAILSDILIAVALCVLLGSNRSEFEEFVFTPPSRVETENSYACESSTNNLINRLIVFAINRCILTSYVQSYCWLFGTWSQWSLCRAVAVVEVIVVSNLLRCFHSAYAYLACRTSWRQFICRPHSFYTFAIDFIIGKRARSSFPFTFQTHFDWLVYTNSLLATLNSRQSFRGMGKDTKVSGTVVSTEFKLSSVVSTTDPRPANIVRVSKTYRCWFHIFCLCYW